MIDLEKLIPRLAEGGVAFVIVGGVAASIHGSAQVTLDLDISYARDEENLTRLVKTLAPLHPRLRGIQAISLFFGRQPRCVTA